MDPDTEIRLFNGTIIGISTILVGVALIWGSRIIYRDYVTPWRQRKAVSNIGKNPHFQGPHFRDRRTLSQNLTEALNTITGNQLAAGTSTPGTARQQHRDLVKTNRWGRTRFRRFLYRITHWRHRR